MSSQNERYVLENSSYKTRLREYIRLNLLGALKRYPTTTQDAILNVIYDRLEELYVYTIRFPEIIAPDSSRLDILQAILKQFDFTIRKEADIEEQIQILDNILHVYNRRGSIDTIENMWKYYGGDLPKDVKVNIPSYSIFRYSISKWSGTHVFQDNENYRSDAYEIALNNSTYPIDKLKEFLLKELVAAGTRIYFTNNVYSSLTDTLLGGGGAAYDYIVAVGDTTYINMKAITYHKGATWDSTGIFSPGVSCVLGGTIENPEWTFYYDEEKYRLSNKGSLLSGSENLLIDLAKYLMIDLIDFKDYAPVEDILRTLISDNGVTTYFIYTNVCDILESQRTVSYTPFRVLQSIERYLYDSDGNLINSRYPGYFIFGETLLGSEVS